MHQQVFQLLKTAKVDLQLAETPTGVLADLTPREAVVGAGQAALLTDRCHHVVDEPEQPAGLRRQIVHGPAQHFVGQAVGDLDVLQRHFDKFHLFAVVLGGLDRPLVLMQERHRPDQRQVLDVVAAGARLVVQEGQRFGEGIGHRAAAARGAGHCGARPRF